MEIQDKYLWTKHLMPLVYEFGSDLPKNSNINVLISLPLTWETLCLVDAIKDKVKLFVIPLTSGENSSLQPGVFKYLNQWKIHYWRKTTRKEKTEALQLNPDIIIDCIGTITEFGVQNKLLDKKTFIIEDTRSGVIKLRKLIKDKKLANPYAFLDESMYKKDFENRHGIGYSIIASLMKSGIVLKNKKLTVVGFGPIGQGIAEYANKLQANVCVVEIDKQRIELASKAGHKVSSLEDTLSNTDIFITCTGENNVLKANHLKSLKNGAILVNAGAEIGEWNREFLNSKPSEQAADDILCYVIDGKKKVFEFGGGNSYNLVSGVAVSSFLDITFSLAILTMKNYMENPEKRGEHKMAKKDLLKLDRLVEISDSI